MASTEFSRRGFVGTSLAGMAALSAKSAAQAPQPAKGFRDPFVYHFKIGEVEAFSISDCDLGFREGLDLMWPVEDRPQMKAEMERHGERLDTLPLHVNVLVLRSGKDGAIFDAGFGKGKQPADGLASGRARRGRDLAGPGHRRLSQPCPRLPPPLAGPRSSPLAMPTAGGPNAGAGADQRITCGANQQPRSAPMPSPGSSTGSSRLDTPSTLINPLLTISPLR